MSSVAKIGGIALLAFALPIAAATVTNWSDLRPYIVGDPKTAAGELYFFTARG